MQRSSGHKLQYATRGNSLHILRPSIRVRRAARVVVLKKWKDGQGSTMPHKEPLDQKSAGALCGEGLRERLRCPKFRYQPQNAKAGVGCVAPIGNPVHEGAVSKTSRERCQQQAGERATRLVFVQDEVVSIDARDSLSHTRASRCRRRPSWRSCSGVIQ